MKKLYGAAPLQPKPPARPALINIDFAYRHVFKHGKLIAYSTGDLYYHGHRELPPVRATFLAFGFVPVTASLTVTELRPDQHQVCLGHHRAALSDHRHRHYNRRDPHLGRRRQRPPAGHRAALPARQQRASDTDRARRQHNPADGLHSADRRPADRSADHSRFHRLRDRREPRSAADRLDLRAWQLRAHDAGKAVRPAQPATLDLPSAST